MVRRCFCIAIFALAALAFSSRQASAQYGGYGINYGDVVSPYLNLLAGGGAASGLPNYQNLVQPIIQNQQSNFNNAAGINQLQGQINGNGGGGGRAGSASRYFMNYSHYYIGIRH